MTRFITSLFLVSFAAAGFASGCGSSFSSKGGKEGDGDGDEVGDGDGDEGATGGMGGMRGALGGQAGEMGGQGGEIVDEPPIEEPPEEPEEPVCDPDAEDLPDDEHFDANCDGIDGDIEGAIFVSPAGSPEGDGTITDPFDTIGAAVALAQEELKDVYVCRGEYLEQVFIEAEGVSLYGGFDCNDGWTRTADPSVVASSAGPALRLKSVYDVHIEGMEFYGRYPVSGEISSIGAVVESSLGVSFKSVLIATGDALSGASGADGVAFPEGQKGLSGAPGKNQIGGGLCDNCYGPGGGTGGISLPAKCPSDQDGEPGGVGGDGADWDNSPTFELGSPSPLSGTPGGMEAGADGTDGANGATGSNAAVSSRGIGVLSGVTYVPNNSGFDGQFGQNGEAGGGGAGGARIYDGAVFYSAGGGGQGGWGSCGGPPGEGGEGGGASIALVVVGSSVEFSNVVLRSGKGGRGGGAGEGAPGQERSDGGPGMLRGGDGGRGGRGGRGGHGSPGGGGPSLGIALRDAELEGTSELTIELGSAGAAGTPVGSRPAPPDGIAAEAYDFEAEQEVEL